MENFATTINKSVKYCCKDQNLRCPQGPGYAPPSPHCTFLCCIFFMLHFFDIEKYWKWTKDIKHDEKMTLHSKLWTCFTYIMISYNTLLSLYSFEWLIKCKWTNLLLCWKRICLPKFETFKTRMWIETYFRYFNYDIGNEWTQNSYTWVKAILVLALLFSKLFNHNHRPR